MRWNTLAGLDNCNPYTKSDLDSLQEMTRSFTDLDFVTQCIISFSSPILVKPQIRSASHKGHSKFPVKSTNIRISECIYSSVLSTLCARTVIQIHSIQSTEMSVAAPFQIYYKYKIMVLHCGQVRGSQTSSPIFFRPWG